MRILYDSKSERYKKPFGCLRQNEVCTLTIDIPRSCDVAEVFICIDSDDQSFSQQFPMEWISLANGYDTFEGSFSLSQSNLYYYYFKIITQNSSFNLFKEGSHDTSMSYGGKWQLTCYDSTYDISDSFKGQVMYQIFPDRFYGETICNTDGKLQPFSIHENKYDVPVYYPDSNGIVQNNDFFGGNLQGIMKKLPYLKELSVSVIYLNPIYMAYSNHRYDTADYRRVDPLLGTDEDFRMLCEEAHKLGMKIILDGVYSHTGSNSVYFDKNRAFNSNGAFNNPSSPYFSWYQMNPNNPCEYISWWGIDTLPCTQEMNEEFLDFIIRGEDSVIEHWMKLGADGYRLDVADELPDEFIRLLNAKVKECNPDSIVIGEVWEDASNKISYGVRKKYFTQRELDSVMNYPYKDAIIGFVKGDRNSESFADTVMSIAENYPKPILDCAMNSLSTHDTMRILTVLGTNDYGISRDAKAYTSLRPEQLEAAIEKLKVASFLQFTLPGTACIYYGDEVGLQGYEDPFNRRYFPWNNMNMELHDFYCQLAKIKCENRPLITGNIKIISESNGVFAFSRELDGEKVFAIVSLREYYECFTDFEPLMLVNGTVREEQITLNKYGFVLLKSK